MCNIIFIVLFVVDRVIKWIDLLCTKHLNQYGKVIIYKNRLSKNITFLVYILVLLIYIYIYFFLHWHLCSYLVSLDVGVASSYTHITSGD